MKILIKNANGFKLLTIFEESFIVDFWLNREPTLSLLNYLLFFRFTYVITRIHFDSKYYSKYKKSQHLRHQIIPT